MHMQLGTQIICEPSDVTSLWTPWLARRADNARFCYEVVATQGSPTLDVAAVHKNAEDVVRDGTGLGLSWTDTVVGNTTFWTATASNLKEMVRFLVELTGSGGGEVEGIIIRFHEPTWFNNA